MMSPEMLIEAGLTRIIGSGACLSRNPVLRAEVQEIYQMPVEFTNEGSACIGAALAAIDVHYQKKSWWKTPWYLFFISCWNKMYYNHYVAMSTQSHGVKIDGLLYPNFI